jgi:hypothetical protein
VSTHGNPHNPSIAVIIHPPVESKTIPSVNVGLIFEKHPDGIGFDRFCKWGDVVFRNQADVETTRKLIEGRDEKYAGCGCLLRKINRKTVDLCEKITWSSTKRTTDLVVDVDDWVVIQRMSFPASLGMGVG